MELILTRVLELREQQFGPILARPRLLHEVGHEPEERAQQHCGDDGCRRAAWERRGEGESDCDASGDGHPERQRQPRNRHQDGCPTRERGHAARLEGGERDSGRAHRHDDGQLEPLATRDERPADCQGKRTDEHAQSERDAEPCAVRPGSRVAVDRPRGDGDDHRETQRTQNVPLPSEPVDGAWARVGNTPALACRTHGPVRHGNLDDRAAAQLDRHQPRRDLEEGHRDEGDRPRRPPDLMGDAEAPDRRLSAVAERECEGHPGPDSGDQQGARDPADPRERDTVTAWANMGREAARDAEREPDGSK